MNIQLTDYGIELLRIGNIPLPITKYELGSDFNYSPSMTATGLKGDIVYTGVPTDPVIINANSVKYTVALDYSVGDFSFGELAFYVNNKCVATAVSDVPIAKTKYSSKNEGNSVVLDLYITVTGRNYYAWIDELKSSNDFTIPVIQTVDALPPPSESSPNFYVISSPSSFYSAFLAYSTNKGIWNFDKYDFYKQFIIRSYSDNSIVISTDGLTKEELSVLNSDTYGQSIIQFGNSNIMGICRYIDNVITSGYEATITFISPLAKLPNVDDRVSLYIRKTNEITASDYVLPIASKDTLGGVKVGSGLNITKDGVLSSSVSEKDIENSVKTLLGKPGGIAPLTDSIENPTDQQELESTRLPERNLTVGALYMPDGTWDASANSINGDASYKLVSGGKIMYKKTPTVYVPYACRGYVLEVGVSGNTEIDGISNWQAGDLILSTGKVWRKISGSQGGISGGLSIPNKSGLVYYESSNQSTRGLEIKSNSLDVSIDTNINIELPENESITPGIYSSVMVNKNGIITEASNIVRGGNF